MATREAHPAMTPRRVAELAELAHKIDREEQEELKQAGRAILLKRAKVRELLAALKAARLGRGLSLADVGERSGIGKANLSRLENDPTPNPTLDTLLRYAEAVGVEMSVSVGGPPASG